MDVLIINFKGADDIIFSTPLIRALKVQLDDTNIHYLTDISTKAVLTDNPYLSKIHGLKFNVYNLIRFFFHNHFDLIIDLENNFTSRFVLLTSRSRVFRLKHQRLVEALMVRLKINKLTNQHLVDRMIETIASLKVKNDDLPLDYFIPDTHDVPQEWLPREFQKGYVVFCLQAPYETRRLPLKRMIELCDKINKPIILLGDQTDFLSAEFIYNFFSKSDRDKAYEEGLLELNKKAIIYNACGKFNIHQRASIIKRSKYVFTFDSDYIAIASAFKKDIISIWGNTIVDFGRYPYHTRFTVLENNKLSCRPCAVTGYARCPLKHFKCMNDIVFDFYIN